MRGRAVKLERVGWTVRSDKSSRVTGQSFSGKGLHTNGGSCEVAAHLTKPEPLPSHTSSRTKAIYPTHHPQKLFSSNVYGKLSKMLTFSPSPIRLRSPRNPCAKYY